MTVLFGGSGALLASWLFTMALSQSANPARVLIYSATREFRHDSIPTAIQALKSNGSSINAVFDSTEDQTQFNDQTLADYDALVFLMNTGEVLDDADKEAFQKYLDLGGNFIGIHSASDCLRTTDFYRNELGAYFDYHPELQNAIVDVVGPPHPSTANLPAQWHVQDEMYNFKSDPRAVGAVVVLSADESSYTDNGTRNFNQGTPHPTAWYQEHGAGVQSGGVAGRSFYTSLGHLNATWQDPLFMSHVLGGISWVLAANTTRAFNSSAQVGNAATASGSGGAATSSPTGTRGSGSSAAASGPSSSPPSASAAGIAIANLTTVIASVALALTLM